jgi:hypothetical protein
VTLHGDASGLQISVGSLGTDPDGKRDCPGERQLHLLDVSAIVS